MAYFVELPNEDGIYAWTSGSHAVVEGHLEETEIGTKLVFEPGQPIAEKWPSVLVDHYGGWVEVDGPARPLTLAEHDALVGYK